jgi:hypothetical protein
MTRRPHTKNAFDDLQHRCREMLGDPEALSDLRARLKISEEKQDELRQALHDRKDLVTIAETLRALHKLREAEEELGVLRSVWNAIQLCAAQIKVNAPELLTLTTDKAETFYRNRPPIGVGGFLKICGGNEDPKESKP